MMLFLWDTSCNRQHQWREVPQWPQPTNLPQEHKPCAISRASGTRLMKSALEAFAHAAPEVVPTHQQPPSRVSAAPCHIVPCLMVLGPWRWWIWMSQQCAEPATVRGIRGKGEKTGDVLHSSKNVPLRWSLSPAASSTVSPPGRPLRGVSGYSMCPSAFLAGVRTRPVLSSVD